MNIPRLTTSTLVLGFLAATLGVMSSPSIATAQTAEPTRIMVVGDSVTHGRDGDYTWRYFAAKGLQQTGANVDFVGPYSETAFGAGGYADPAFDHAHAARWGLSLWETLYQPGPTAPRISALVTNHQPVVLVEILGVNDFLWLGQSATAVRDDVLAFVTEAREAKPDVDIVLGSLPQTWIGGVTDFNVLLAELAIVISTPESRVVATPVAAWVNGTDTYDPAHPTSLGERKLAEAVSVALEQLGVGTAVRMSMPAVTTPITPPVVIEPLPVAALLEPIGVVVPLTPVDPVIVAESAAAPAAPLLRAKALTNGRVKVSWSAQAASVQLWVRDVTARRKWSVLGSATATSSRVVRAAQGHRLRFRASATNAGIASSFSAIVTVRTAR